MVTAARLERLERRLNTNYVNQANTATVRHAMRVETQTWIDECTNHRDWITGNNGITVKWSDRWHDYEGTGTSATQTATGWAVNGVYLKSYKFRGNCRHDQDDWTAHDIWPQTATGTTTGNIIIRAGTTTNAANTITFNVGEFATNDVWVYNGEEIVQKNGRRYKPPRQILNHRGEPARAADKGTLWSSVQPEELVALQLLRKMVEPEAFKKYLKHGFVSVTGPSGLVYQIKRGHDHIKVWDDGDHVASLCVHLKDWCGKPPTDEVVAKMVIAECDEPDLWKRSNKPFLDRKKERPRLRLVGAA